MRDSTGTGLHTDPHAAIPGESPSTHESHIQGTSIGSFRVSVDSTVGSGKSKSGPAGGFDSAVIERYRLETLLGKGGFGEVWKAFDTKLGKHVAIKGPRTDRPISPLHVQQFLAEAEKVKQIGGAAVVPVLEVVHCPARQTGEFLCFIVMELMTGGSLGAKSRQGWRPTASEAVSLVIRLADKLALIHGHGFIHRDVKPDNILFDAAGNPYFSDFGLAVSDDELLKEGQCVRGTVAYMAPEQARQQRVDRQADIYSLGVVLYQLLAQPYFAQPKLALPYLANSSDEYLELLSDQRQQARALPEGVPNELAAIVEHHCLTADKTKRYRNAQDLAQALRHWLRRVTWPRRAALIAGCAAIGAAAVGGAAAFQGELPEKSVPELKVENQVSLVELLGPSQPQGWSVSPQGTDLQVTTREIVLISFGTHQHESTEFEITFSPEHWSGEYGVFFGHGPAVEPEESYYQAIKLASKSGAGLSASTCGVTYRLNSLLGVHTVYDVGIRPGPEVPIDFTTNTLRIHLESGKLAGAWINQFDLRERLVERWLKSDLGAFGRSIGEFGIICRGGPCRFTAPRLNKTSISLKY